MYKRQSVTDIANNGLPRSSYSEAIDGARAGQPFNDEFYAGISSASLGTLTFGRQRALGTLSLIHIFSLYPGLVRTEAVVAAAKDGSLDLSNSESPEFIGRVVAALARDPALMERAGKVVIAAEVAAELGVGDVDGRQPAPLTLETA